MKTKILYSIIFFILLMAACAPVATPEPSAPVQTEPAPVSGLAIVQSIEVQVRENSPIQVNAIVRGQLPDSGCTTIASIDQARDGNTFRLTLTTTTDPLALCAAALTPFEQVVALDVNDLPPARYIVNANGIESTFDLVTRDPSIFKQQLVEALNSHNYELLRLMMDKSLMIAFWRSEGTAYEVEPAIEQLRVNYLSNTAAITADPAKNLIELLGGTDPISILGPDGQQIQASALYVSGWGLDGKDEAILFVATQPDGSLYWHGVLVAKGGFAEQIPVTGPSQPIDTNAYAANIQYIMAQQDVSVYSGPAGSFEVLGKLYSGQIAMVTGQNVNGSWWRVVCLNNSVGNCWVSADRSLTRPTTLPNNNQSPPDTEAIPTISIVEVVRDGTVTIKTQNFPANTKFYVRMGKMGTKGVDGILVDAFNSKKGGSFTATFDIPWKLYGEKQIAIRLESNNGYYSYNWFDNATFANTKPDLTDYLSTNVKYVMALDTIVIRNGPGSQYAAIGSVAYGQTSKVTGISKDGDWWRIVCPDGKAGSCWVSAKPKNTKPTDAPASDSAQPTNVKYVLALQNVSIHNGPGNKYNVIGSVASGQIAKVTGINDNGKWWRVICPNDTVGSCWVSADQNLTRPTDLTGNADVQSIEIQMIESSPVQVNAIARGQLPDAGCTTISSASQVRNGNTFTVKVTTKTDPAALCALTLTPFEYVISLDVSSLLPAKYIVNVNGVEESFDLPGVITPTE
jgi:uncharacterized protein YgiM (DUF1202 family)